METHSPFFRVESLEGSIPSLVFKWVEGCWLSLMTLTIVPGERHRGNLTKVSQRAQWFGERDCGEFSKST